MAANYAPAPTTCQETGTETQKNVNINHFTEAKNKICILLINNYFIKLSFTFFFLLLRHSSTKARMLNRFTCAQGKY